MPVPSTTSSPSAAPAAAPTSSYPSAVPSARTAERVADAAVVSLAAGAEDNGLATMLADLLRQNLEAKPHKKVDFDALALTSRAVAIVADDAEVALTLRFSPGRVVVHDGIVGIPDVTVRGSSDVILALSNLPLSTPFALPIPDPRDKAGLEHVRTVFRAMRAGTFHVYGMAFNLPLLLRLTRVMSVEG